ncbi:hypothetical protein PIB30_084206, partial [Stylosanthes scabra]|nr:hypothetical protein [Stylosanthes scabra]
VGRWEGAWEQVYHVVRLWSSGKTKTKWADNRDKIGFVRLEEAKPLWWQCILFMAEENRYVIGGYYTDENGIICCWMGEEIAGVSDGEAYLQGLESAIQFLIEDANVDNECITLISNRKDLVD